MGTVISMQIRSVRRPEDIDALDELFDLVTACDGHRPIGEHKYLDLLHGDPAKQTGIVAEIEDAIVAYAALSEPTSEATGALELAIHPLHRSDEVVRGMLAAGVERLRSLGARRVRMWAFQPHLVGVLESLGFVSERELRQLRRALPVEGMPAFPPTVVVRGFRMGVDEAAWLDVNNGAFAGHPENGRWTRAVLEDREVQPWFDTDGVRMAWEAGELVGFCWTKMHDARLGEIYVIAVAPTHQGRGLGRALVLEGLRYLTAERGAEAAMLYVDTDNAGAIALYERLGFGLDHVDRSLVKRLDQ